MGGWRDQVNDRKPLQPGIDISSYAMPVAANADLVGVAVLYLTKGEAEAVKAFAQEVKRRRGAQGVQSVTLAWGERVTTAKQNKDYASQIVGVLKEALGVAPPGWTKFRNMAVDRIEYIAPDNKRYVQDKFGKFVEVPATCNRGHALPKGTSWCKICEQGGYSDTGAASPKVKPEPVKPLDRFEGLDL